MSYCIYCLKDTAPNPSLEHIWPKAFGGKLCNDLFKTRNVCAGCNNNLGLFVDGMFIKSRFVQNHYATEATHYADPQKNRPTPFVYMGRLDVERGDEEVEYWLGPTGEGAFRFQKRGGDFYKVYAGGDPRDRKKNKDRVYLFSRHNQENWLRHCLLSFRINFSGRLVPANMSFSDERWLGKGGFALPDAIDSANIDWLLKIMANEKLRCRDEIQAGFEHRFLSKLALGFGHNIFGVPFSRSAWADDLRNDLWNKEKFATHPGPVTGCFDETMNNAVTDLFHVVGGFVIQFLFDKRVGLGLLLTIPGKKMLTSLIAPTELCDEKMLPHLNLAHVVVPALNKFIAITQFDFIAHKNNNITHPGLAQIEAEQRDPATRIDWPLKRPDDFSL